VSESPRSEKGEKEEKDEKGKGESWEEKWRRDPVEAAVWALILIWVGLVWLAVNLGWLKAIVGSMEPWAVGLIGAGVLVLLGVLLRLVVPAYRRPVLGSVIFGLILIGIGLGQVTQWEVLVPIVIIGIGLTVLLGGLLRKR